MQRLTGVFFSLTTHTVTHNQTSYTRRLLTVWSDYGYLPEAYETLAGGLKTVDIGNTPSLGLGGCEEVE